MKGETGAEFYDRVVRPLIHADLIANGYTREQIEADEEASRLFDELYEQTGSIEAAEAVWEQMHAEKKAKAQELVLAG